MSKNAPRIISATEVLAVQKQVEGLSDTSIETWLGTRGYSSADTKTMMTKLKAASQGQLELAQWDKDLIEADEMSGERERYGEGEGEGEGGREKMRERERERERGSERASD